MSPDYSAAKMAALATTYLSRLIAAHNGDPTRYRWPIEQAPKVAAATFAQIAERGIHTVAIDGPAWKATLKEVNLKPTYKALDAYLRT